MGSCWEHVRKDIFDYIISELGSLERMDDQIRKLMAQMLMRNLANVEKATGSLVDSLGQGSATVVSLSDESFKSLVASGRRQTFPCRQFCTCSEHAQGRDSSELTHSYQQKRLGISSPFEKSSRDFFLLCLVDDSSTVTTACRNVLT